MRKRVAVAPHKIRKLDMLAAQIDQQRVTPHVTYTAIGDDDSIEFTVAIEQEAPPVMRGLVHRGFDFERAIPDAIARAVRKSRRLPMRGVEAVADDVPIVE